MTSTVSLLARRQHGHPDQSPGLGLVDGNGARPTTPEDSGFMNAQGGGAAVGQFDLHEAAPRKGQGPDHCGREREVAGETGVDHGLDLGATPGRSEHREGHQGLASVGADAPAQAKLPFSEAGRSRVPRIGGASDAADAVGRRLPYPDEVQDALGGLRAGAVEGLQLLVGQRVLAALDVQD